MRRPSAAETSTTTMACRGEDDYPPPCWTVIGARWCSTSDYSATATTTTMTAETDLSTRRMRTTPPDYYAPAATMPTMLYLVRC